MKADTIQKPFRLPCRFESENGKTKITAEVPQGQTWKLRYITDTSDGWTTLATGNVTIGNGFVSAVVSDAVSEKIWCAEFVRVGLPVNL